MADMKDKTAVLKDSETRYRRLFETAQDGILILDAETGQIDDVNPFLINILGYSHEEFLGKKIWDIGFFKDVVSSRASFKELQTKEYIRYDNLPLKTKDGRHIAVEFVSNVYLVDHKKVIQCNIRDITARREIEAGLEKTRKELVVIKKSADEAHEYAESVINTVREPLIALDQDLRVVSVSRSFYEFFKVNPEETVGQLIYDLGNKQWDIPKLRELLETILPQKAIFDNYEVEHNFATIGRRIMLLNGRQIEQEAGKKKIILLAIEDITERKEIEAGLEKTRQELAVIKKSADEALEYADSTINTIREPLIVLDQDLRVVTVSRSFYEFFKVNPEETVGQLIYDLGNKQWDIPKLRELLETILPQKATFDNYEVEHNFATIGQRIMLLNARQIERLLGKERIILLAIEDITERKQLDNEIKRSNESLEQFAYVASHDLQEPLRVMSNYSQLLEKRYKGKLDNDADDFIGFIVDAARRMQKLISDILEYSRVGRKESPVTEVDSNKLVDKVIKNLSETIKSAGATVTHGNLPVINVPESSFAQLFQNLIGNALKFHGKEPTKIIVSAEKQDTKWKFGVHDNGIGNIPGLCWADSCSESWKHWASPISRRITKRSTPLLS